MMNARYDRVKVYEAGTLLDGPALDELFQFVVDTRRIFDYTIEKEKTEELKDWCRKNLERYEWTFEFDQFCFSDVKIRFKFLFANIMGKL